MPSSSALPPGTFDVVITGDEVSNGKPHPEPYLAAAARSGVRAKDCAAIEDSPTGVRSAVAAGCRTFAVPNVVDIPPAAEYTRVRSLHEIDLAMLGITGADRPRKRRRGGVCSPPASPSSPLSASAPRSCSRDDPLPPLLDIPVSAWAPYWTLADGTASVAAHGTTLHEVSPFWYQADGADDISLSGNGTAELTLPLIAAIRDTGGKVVPSISDAMPKGGMAAVLADDAQRAEHVAAIVELVADERLRRHRHRLRTVRLRRQRTTRGRPPGRTGWRSSSSWPRRCTPRARSSRSASRPSTTAAAPPTAATGCTTTPPSARWSIASASWATTTASASPAPSPRTTG